MQTAPDVIQTRTRRGLRDHSIPIPLLRRFRCGDVLAEKYRLECLIGEGSMGEVWLAENIALEMPVAVKFLRRSGIDGTSPLDLLAEVASQQLVLEARATAKLVHPGIVRTLDFGTDRGYPFLVLEHLQGEELRERLDREGRLPAIEASRLVLPVLDAVEFAHAHGIVHKDLKPENVFLVTDDTGLVRPKVLDFGLSVLETEARGLVAGTPAYMAPEQRTAGPTDLRVDVYAASVMLLELVIGQRPSDAPPASFSREAGFFAGDAATAIDLLWAADPTLVPPTLANILVRGLAPEPDDRWPSLAELGRAIARWLIDRGVEDDAAGLSLRSHWLGPNGREPEISVDLVEPEAEILTDLGVAPAPQPRAELALPAPYFGEDPIVVPKKRHAWAALGAVVAIVAAATVTASMASGVTTVDAFRSRVIDPWTSHASPRAPLAADDATAAPAVNRANTDATEVIGQEVPAKVATAATAVDAPAPTPTIPSSRAADAPRAAPAAPAKHPMPRAVTVRAKHLVAPTTTASAAPVEDDPTPVNPSDVYVEPKAEPLPTADAGSYDPSSI